MATTTLEPRTLPTEQGKDMHPGERWMYRKLTEKHFWRYYRPNKGDYGRFSAAQVAELAKLTKVDFWHLIYKLGFGIEVIGIDEVKAYYEETRPGYTVDVVATQE